LPVEQAIRLLARERRSGTRRASLGCWQANRLPHQTERFFGM
jgi:hypothetical protein